MTIEKLYLGWCEGESPAAGAARMLLKHAPSAADGAADLSSSLIVVTSSRVMRHVRYELLTQARLQRLPLMPPAMCTVESLGARTLGGSIAEERVSSGDWLIALDQALEKLTAGAAELLAPHGLPSNPKSRIAMVQQLQSIIEQATHANRSLEEIALMPLVADSQSAHRRWKSLQELTELAQSTVQSVGERRPLSAFEWNQRLITAGTSTVGRVILLGVLDATPLTRAIIARLESLEIPISAWIVAPENHAGTGDAESSWFDELGCVRRDALREGPTLCDDQIEPAEGPEDQCQAAVARYASIAQKVAPASPDPGSIVIVNGEPALNAVLGRTIETHGRSAHFGAGKPFSQTLAGKLLGALAEVNASPHPDALGSLVAHPCVSAGARRSGATFDLVCELDLARADSLVNDLEHLESLGTDWREAKGGALMSQLRALFNRFIPQTMGENTSGAWVALTQDLARTIRRTLQGTVGDPAQEAACVAMDQVVAQLQAGVWGDAPTTVDSAVAFLYGVLRNSDVPIAPDGYEVEVIGWLDSLFDPSSSMILMGIREGTIPSAPLPDGWLNGSLRTELGLGDRSQRLARDAYVLHAIAARTKDLVIVSGQTNANDDPTIPSRLLFPAQGVDQARRVRRLLDMNAENRLRPAAAFNAKSSCFFNTPIPEDYPHLALPEKLSITSFKSYLDSPYEFWLDKVFGLSATGLDTESLDPLQFGTLMHEALAQFGDPQIRTSTDRGKLQGHLERWVRATIARRYGTNPKAGVILQADIMIERLFSAIEWHLEDREQGWILQATEWKFPTDMQIDVDGVPQVIGGRIDRIDRQKETGEWRIIDYKTGDAKADPDEATLCDGVFLDLQLPLYRLLAPLHYLEMNGSLPSIGYVTIPAAPAVASFQALQMESALDAIALEEARRIIGRIRARDFGSPDGFKTQDEGFKRLLRQVCFSPPGDSGVEEATP